MASPEQPSGPSESGPPAETDPVRFVCAIEGNRQRLDGGAMFGNCPRTVWQTWAPPDELNRIELACRCLLVRDSWPTLPPGSDLRMGDRPLPGSSRTVLLEAGIGAFFEPKLRTRYGIQSERHDLLDALAARGVEPSEIDIVVLSHLHFDHAGGLLSAWSADEPLNLVFPRAHYVVGERAWDRACRPHPRDRASFIPQLQALLEATGRLHRVATHHFELLGPHYRFAFSDGHTPGLMLTKVHGPRGPITFLSDLVPGVPWVHLPITMGYDRFPERLIDEKRSILGEIHKENGWAFFTHDPHVAAARIDVDDQARFVTHDHQTELEWTGG